MSDDTYNGWANRESWAIALHLSNDQGLYELTTSRVAMGLDDWEPVAELADYYAEDPRRLVNSRLRAAGDALEGFVRDDLFGPWAGNLTPDEAIAMLLDVGSLWRVDWAAVARGFVPDDVDLAMPADEWEAIFVDP